jgi:hypothetical protein
MCSSRVAAPEAVEADEAHARYSSARADLLRSVAELASTGAWRGDGAADLASWMCARWQMSGRTARELVRDAQALKARPALGEALASGSISIDQCKALAVLCDEDSDDDEVWLEMLSSWSYPELAREARKHIARELERRDDGVFLRMAHTPDERYLRGEFQLHPEDGAVVMAAIDARIAHGTALRDLDRAAGLALVELAKATDGGTVKRPWVVVSVSEAALAGKADAVAAVGTGRDVGFVAAETARRLDCDATRQLVVKDEQGRITGVGRNEQAISRSTRRAVEDRDGGMCTFPGCERDVFVECHHIDHREHGGSNHPDNLLLVCWTHHALVHEGGWSLKGPAGPHITWVRPDGSPFEPRVRVVLDTS